MPGGREGRGRAERPVIPTDFQLDRRRQEVPLGIDFAQGLNVYRVGVVDQERLRQVGEIVGVEVPRGGFVRERRCFLQASC